jgi:tRNA 2-(methylsulfanyl)-N6-isopentenyladenosine37 hydroxylase
LGGIFPIFNFPQSPFGKPTPFHCITFAFMLGLKLATDPRWANAAEKSIDEILIDHAYCEQKAATTGISLIVQYPEMEKMVKECTAIVAEEWGHFRKVLKELEKRGFKFGPQRKDVYVNELMKLITRGGDRNEQVAERLLLLAMIEARSCERFRVLSLNIQDPDLKQFYHEFMVSEAGHYRTFIDLAKEYKSKEYVKVRWEQILEGEAEIMKRLTPQGSRIH